MPTTNSFPAAFKIPSFGTDMIEITKDLSDRQFNISAALYTIFPESEGSYICSIPCSSKFTKDSAAMFQIREAVQDEKPVSKKCWNIQRPMKMGSGVCRDYFTKKEYPTLLGTEQAFLQEHDYDIDVASYVAIPFPDDLVPHGNLFLFFHEEKALNIFLNVAEKFSAQMKEYFNG